MDSFESSKSALQEVQETLSKEQSFSTTLDYDNRANSIRFPFGKSFHF